MTTDNNSQTLELVTEPTTIQTTTVTRSHVPKIDRCYYTFGNFSDILAIVESREFWPIWITGLAGNGKTQLVEQACARAFLPKEYFKQGIKNKEKTKILDAHEGNGREFIRVNFTKDTAAETLIGGFRLDYIDAIETDPETGKETVVKKEIGTTFHEGPVIEALRAGAVLLLDEIDAGNTNNVLCLQSVLEGKGALIPETGEWVNPAPGFQVFATSNTKGKGSENGQYGGTFVMNSAFLDRFGGMIFQDYPDRGIEDLILKRYYINFLWSDGDDSKPKDKAALREVATLVANLCDWAAETRAAQKAGACDDSITTRSLINILKGYSVLNDLKKAIEMSCERFDADTKESMLSLYDFKTGLPEGKTSEDDEQVAF